MRLALFVCAVTGLLLADAAPVAQRGPVVLIPAGRAAGSARAIASPQAALQHFRARIAADRELSLIVEVRTPVRVDAPSMTAAEEQAEAGLLRQARRNVIRRLPAEAHGLREFDAIPFFAVIADALTFEVLLSDPNVVSMQEDAMRRATLKQSVPLVQANQAWARGYTGAGVAVAILDTGVDRTHPVFGDRVVSEACYSGGGRKAESVCPGRALSSTAAGSAKPCTPRDSCSHGTHVAATVAGSTGVAKAASIVAIQVFSRDDNDVGAWDSDILKGMNRVYALRNKYKVAALNMSIGGDEEYDRTCDASSRAYTAMIAKLYQARIATVVASGNEGFTAGLSSPACHSKVISVGNSTKANKVNRWSNSATFLSLLAPGTSINAAIPGGGRETMTGTSMAAPHVAGAWAILRQRKPTLTVAAGLAALRNTGLNITDSRNGRVFKRIRINNALSTLTAR